MITKEQAELMNIMIQEKQKANEHNFLIGILQMTDEDKIEQMIAFLVTKKMQLHQMISTAETTKTNIQAEISKIDEMII